MLLILTQIVFFQETPVFLQFSGINLYQSNRDYLHLENLICWKYFFKTLNKFSHGNNELCVPASNIDGFPCASSMVQNRPILEKWAFLQLQMYDLQEDSYHTLPELSQGIIVLDAVTSNIPGFLRRDTYAYQLTWTGLFAAKTSHLHLKRPNCRKYSLQKLKTVFIGKKCGRCSCF
jgi:hypothetical protein